MKAKAERRRRVLFGKKGTTILEIMVTLLIAALILALAAAGITADFRLYSRMIMEERSVELATILCDDVQFSLGMSYGYTVQNASQSKVTLYQYHETGSEAEPPFWPMGHVDSNAVDLIFYQENSGNNACMTVRDGKIVIFYPENPTVSEWSLGTDAYYNLAVSEFKLEQVNVKEPYLVLKLTILLTARNGNWNYRATRYIRCENVIIRQEANPEDRTFVTVSYSSVTPGGGS